MIQAKKKVEPFSPVAMSQRISVCVCAFDFNVVYLVQLSPAIIVVLIMMPGVVQQPDADVPSSAAFFLLFHSRGASKISGSSFNCVSPVSYTHLTLPTKRIV